LRARQRLHQGLIYARHAGGYMMFRHKLSRSVYGRIIPKRNAFFNRKFAAPYLASFLTPGQRLSIQAWLCDFIESGFGPPEFAARLKDGLELWRSAGEHGVQSVRLSLPVRTMLEGDLTLEHCLDGELLHRMSFALIPGSILDISEPCVAFIGGMQGKPGSAHTARLAAKDNGEIHPAHMTMIALRGLCQSLGVASICGVKADSQTVVAGAFAAHLAAYDQFWRSQHGEERAGYYLMPAMPAYDDTTHVGAANRSRARRKRRLRMALTLHVRCELERLRQAHGDR
jgi:uncharacterized protein VirK/YbjX